MRNFFLRFKSLRLRTWETRSFPCEVLLRKLYFEGCYLEAEDDMINRYPYIFPSTPTLAWSNENLFGCPMFWSHLYYVFPWFTYVLILMTCMNSGFLNLSYFCLKCLASHREWIFPRERWWNTSKSSRLN